jgi:hypothetical protein
MFARFAGVGVGHGIQYDSPAIRRHRSEYLEDCEYESDDDSDSTGDTTMEDDSGSDDGGDGDIVCDAAAMDVGSDGSGIEYSGGEDEESGSDSEFEDDVTVENRYRF